MSNEKLIREYIGYDPHPKLSAPSGSLGGDNAGGEEVE